MVAGSIIGLKISKSMNSDIVMAALNLTILDRNNPKDVIHHNNIGVQCLFIRYTDKMTESGVGVIASVRMNGDSYDSALAKNIKGLYKSEVIHYLQESWNGINDIQLATLEWVD